MNQAADYAESAEQLPSRGLGLATGMLLFMIAEVVVFMGIPVDSRTPGHTAFIAAMFVDAGIQVTGMLLTWQGRYRIGGNLQIVASALHVLDLMGIIGVIGGLHSRRYPEKLAELREE